MLAPWIERIYELLLALVIMTFYTDDPNRVVPAPDVLATATPVGYVATPTPCPTDLLAILAANSAGCAYDVLTTPFTDETPPTATPTPQE